MKKTNVQIRRWSIGFVILLAVALTIVLLAPSPAMPAVACDANRDSTPLMTDNFAGVPSQVLEDARTLAHEFYGKDSAKADNMVSQLVATYQAASDKDFVVFFNPGGWGWDPMSEIPGWESILQGIDSTLNSYGFRTLLVDYKRTAHGLNGVIGETEVLLGIQPMKANELAARVDFLTRHLPGLRVILTGESNGAAICEDAMSRLEGNPRVFAIQTGPPFWHRSLPLERSLVIENNGVQPDAFSTGDWVVILRANLEAAFGIYRGSKGNILLYIGAPGHDYNWDYPTVRTQITEFLAQKFAPAVN